MSNKSQEAKTRENSFQNDILDQMQSHGWLLGESKKYNKELALYPEDLISFVQTTQPEQWEKQLRDEGYEELFAPPSNNANHNSDK